MIRDRVPSIDLWKTFGQLIENPENAFIEIIQAEQKNFVTFIWFAALFKIYILSIILSSVISSRRFSLLNFLVLLIFSIFPVILTGLFLKKIVNKKLIEFRLKDYFA
ncbi:MAG: hypothetical protein WC557_04525, partial [Ignavibacteriaceae bacterium]